MISTEALRPQALCRSGSGGWTTGTSRSRFNAIASDAIIAAHTVIRDLAVEGLTNQAHVDDRPWGPPILTREIEHNPANPEAGDPEVIEAVVEALKHETPGGSFIQGEYEKECRALLKGPVRRISLFTYDPDWRNSLGEVPYLSTAWADDRDNVADDGDGFDGGLKDLLAGGGYHTFKA
jgi:hypothetical protein